MALHADPLEPPLIPHTKGDVILSSPKFGLNHIFVSHFLIVILQPNLLICIARKVWNSLIYIGYNFNLKASLNLQLSLLVPLIHIFFHLNLHK